MTVLLMTAKKAVTRVTIAVGQGVMTPTMAQQQKWCRLTAVATTYQESVVRNRSKQTGSAATTADEYADYMQRADSLLAEADAIIERNGDPDQNTDEDGGSGKGESGCIDGDNNGEAGGDSADAESASEDGIE